MNSITLGNAWKMIDLQPREWKQDTSGIYTVINWTSENKVRVDVMSNLHMPIVSMQGDTAETVYKGLADWIEAKDVTLSAEHLLYIGKELARCEHETTAFTQD